MAKCDRIVRIVGGLDFKNEQNNMNFRLIHDDKLITLKIRVKNKESLILYLLNKCPSETHSPEIRVPHRIYNTMILLPIIL